MLENHAVSELEFVIASVCVLVYLLGSRRVQTMLSMLCCIGISGQL